MSLNNKSFECPCHSKRCNELLYYKKDVRKAVKEDYKNTVLAKRREISWQEYARRRIEIFGEELV